MWAAETGCEASEESLNLEPTELVVDPDDARKSLAGQQGGSLPETRLTLRFPSDPLSDSFWACEVALYRTLQSLDPDAVELAQAKQLDDGTVGYFARVPRKDDCFAAALATTLQVPIEEVPDPQIDQRLAAGATPSQIDLVFRCQLHDWLAARGLRMLIHREPPVRLRRWIGVVTLPGAFNDHCLVMTKADVLFDPARQELLRPPAEGQPVNKIRRFGLRHVAFGLSFRSTTERTKPWPAKA